MLSVMQILGIELGVHTFLLPALNAAVTYVGPECVRTDPFQAGCRTIQPIWP